MWACQGKPGGTLNRGAGWLTLNSKRSSARWGPSGRKLKRPARKRGVAGVIGTSDAVPRMNLTSAFSDSASSSS